MTQIRFAGRRLVAPSQPRQGLPGKRFTSTLPAAPTGRPGARPASPGRTARARAPASTTTAAPTSGASYWAVPSRMALPRPVSAAGVLGEERRDGGVGRRHPHAGEDRRQRPRQLHPAEDRQSGDARSVRITRTCSGSTERKPSRARHGDREEADQRHDHELRREAEAEVDDEQRRDRDHRARSGRPPGADRPPGAAVADACRPTAAANPNASADGEPGQHLAGGDAGRRGQRAALVPQRPGDVGGRRQHVLRHPAQAHVGLPGGDQRGEHQHPAQVRAAVSSQRLERPRRAARKAGEAIAAARSPSPKPAVELEHDPARAAATSRRPGRTRAAPPRCRG